MFLVCVECGLSEHILIPVLSNLFWISCRFVFLQAVFYFLTNKNVENTPALPRAAPVRIFRTVTRQSVGDDVPEGGGSLVTSDCFGQIKGRLGRLWVQGASL